MSEATGRPLGRPGPEGPGQRGSRTLPRPRGRLSRSFFSGGRISATPYVVVVLDPATPGMVAAVGIGRHRVGASGLGGAVWLTVGEALVDPRDTGAGCVRLTETMATYYGSSEHGMDDKGRLTPPAHPGRDPEASGGSI